MPRRHPLFRRKPPEPSLPVEWIIVGLGNPGPEYRGTRHNVGFEVIERLTEKNRIKLDRGKGRAMVGRGRIAECEVMLVKPLTYMNLSGQAVGPLAKSLGVPPARVLVIADDLDLPTGKLRLREKGGAGGHNGHKSLISSLGTQEYPRLRVGISKGDGATVDHVLSTFNPDERALIDDAVKLSCEIVDLVLRGDWGRAQERAEHHLK